MNLLSKANLYYIATTLVIFLIAGIAVYISLQDLIYEEVDELLLEQKSAFIDELNELGGFAFIFLPKDSSIIVGPQITDDKMFQPEFRDTMLYSYLEDEVVPFRQIVFPAAYEDDIYVITIRRSLFESDDLIETIIFSLSGIFLIAVLIFTAVNFFGLRRLWHPFYRILEQIKTYNFRASKNLKPVETNIDEFKELQTLLDRMTSKLSRDYQTLKEFSENASHEMQTPLAIIRSKLELLLQQKKGNGEEIKSLDEIYKAVNRLTRLHKSLNLLTRLANNEFTEHKSLHLKPFLEQQIENYKDMISFKNLSLQVSIDDDPVLNVNEYLFEILISNLLSNAIYHNIEGGCINILVRDGRLEISNDGSVPEVNPEMYFERFKKGKSDSDSSGLGLSIAQQICHSFGYEISYTFRDGKHIIKLNF